MNPFVLIGIGMFIILIACAFMSIDTMPNGIGIPPTQRISLDPHDDLWARP